MACSRWLRRSLHALREGRFGLTLAGEVYIRKTMVGGSRSTWVAARSSIPSSSPRRQMWRGPLLEAVDRTSPTICWASPIARRSPQRSAITWTSFRICRRDSVSWCRAAKGGACWRAHSCITNFRPRSKGKGILRCFLGGARDEAVLNLTDDEIVDTVRKELKELVELDARPMFEPRLSLARSDGPVRAGSHRQDWAYRKAG